MLKCPTCGRVYEDNRQMFCLNDGAALLRVEQNPSPTVQYSGALPRAAANLQPPPLAKKRNHLLLFGGLGALMLVLFIAVVLFVGVILNLKNKDTPVNTANVATSQTPVTLVSNEDKYQPELKMAINSANNAQSAAYANLDTSMLRNYYSGEALKSFSNDVENLKKGKIYQTSTLQKQDYEYFKVNDAATEAEVRVVEIWETNVYQTTTKKCVAYYPPTRTPQTVYLKKTSGSWIIDSTVYDAGIKKEPQPCPKKK